MTSPTATSAPAPNTSLWEDFTDIFYAPSQVYERRRDGRFGPALIVLALLGLALFFIFRPMWSAVTDVAIAQSLRSNPNLTPEQVQSARQMSEKFGVVGGVFQAVLGYPIAVAITALTLWLVGKMFGATERFAQAMTIATYANFPRLLGTAVAGALYLMGQPSEVRSPFSILVSPLRFVDESTVSPLVAAFLSRFDLFTLWTTALLAIGLHVIGRISKGSAAMAAGLVWVLGSLFAIASVARQAAAG
jgi:hypothetical protein